MAYLISEEAQDLLQDVKNFCDKEVAEQCKEYDVSGEWPKAIYDKAVEQGYQALEVPEEFGGPGLSRVDVAALIEQMAIADAGFATTISASGLGMKPVLIAGSDEQKQHVCDLILDGGFGAFCLTEPGAGSDASAGKTTAVKDGDEYVLNGRKCFITNGGVASFYCVTAMTDKSKGVKGISMFLVDAGTPGLSTGHEENKMGIRTSNTCDVVFEDCRIPAARRFARSVFSCVTASSVPVASATAAAGVGAGPVGPIGPSAPTGPVGPVAPAGPVGPVAPAGPVGPASPAGPAGPVAAAGPVGPFAPAGPVAPRGPVAPCPEQLQSQPQRLLFPKQDVQVISPEASFSEEFF